MKEYDEAVAECNACLQILEDQAAKSGDIEQLRATNTMRRAVLMLRWAAALSEHEAVCQAVLKVRP